MVAGAFGPVTVAKGANGEKMTVPPATPGPVPSVSALNVMPSGRPRLLVGSEVPRVNVSALLILTSLAAHIIRLPSVTVMAAFWFRLRPAPSKTLPRVAVMGAFTLISRPQHAEKLPSTAVTAALILISLSALRVRVVGAPAAVQLTAWLTKISPFPGPDAVVMFMLLLTSCADSVDPLMLPPAPMMKSCGSISQVPTRPCGAAVLTRTSSRMLTRAADVSIKPPLPPLGALASSVPLTFSVPVCISPSRKISPLRLPMACACITPVLLTTLCNSSPTACADINTRPPSARTMPPFSTSAFTAPWEMDKFSRPSPLTSKVMALPAASTTLPNLAEITPWLLMLLPSSAT